MLLEGILVFYNKEVRDLFDMKLFVDTDADTRLARRGKKEVVDERSKQGCKVDYICLFINCPRCLDTELL